MAAAPPPPKFTGLACPACKQPVAQIEHQIGKHTLTFHCPACRHRWSASDPGTPTQ
jgi:uncharacterized protein YbaR (Trm112 family)